MRIGIPGQFAAMKTAGLMQGMNQAGDRAMRHDLAQQEIDRRAEQHAAEMALKQMELSQTGRLGERKLGLEEKVADRTFETDGRRLGMDEKRLALEGRSLDDVMTRHREGISSTEGLARAGREFDATQRGLDRRHDTRKLSVQHMNERDLLRERAELEQDAEGPNGWRRVADNSQWEARYGRQVGDARQDASTAHDRKLAEMALNNASAFGLAGLQEASREKDRSAMRGNTLTEIAGKELTVVSPEEREAEQLKNGGTAEQAAARIILARLKELAALANK